MKIFVTGANGFLGQHLVKLLLDKNCVVIATGRGPSRLLFQNATYKYFDVDIRDEIGLENIMLAEKPDMVIHTAAMTRVDDCELNQDESFKINVLGTSFALRHAEKFSNHFIHVSTDFVFDGAKGNYKEDDATGFVNWYGFTKIEAEQLVSRAKIPWSIVRTCLVYGNALYGTRNNIISWVKEKLEKGEKIKVVDDQVRTPTYVEDLAKGIISIVEKNAGGIFHISGKDILTPYAMAQHTADFFSLDKTLIEKVNASNFTEPAKRPPKTGFIIDKARRELEYEPVSFEEGLRKMFGGGH
jgi:dTDP-4-dehydrorhamnose reductase